MKGETLATELKITYGRVSLMENGLVNFRISELYNIARILSIDVSELVLNSYG